MLNETSLLQCFVANMHPREQCVHMNALLVI
jgi:hypothetical protein